MFRDETLKIITRQLFPNGYRHHLAQVTPFSFTVAQYARIVENLGQEERKIGTRNEY